MKLSEKKQRRDAIIARQLEIQAILAEMKRAWICDGQPGPQSVRATLEAEYAALAVERNHILAALKADKVTEAALRSASLLSTLMQMLRDRGMSDIVRDAHRLSADAHLAVSVKGHE